MKDENLILASLKCLKREPLPKGMTSRELVSRAIEYRDPPRVPYYFMFNPNASDIGYVAPLSTATNTPTKKLSHGQRYNDAWGITWEVTGRYWDHAVGYPLEDLSNLDQYRFPDCSREIKGLGFLSRLGNLAGKYIIGTNPIMLSERVRSLMGYEGMMLAPYDQPDGLHKLLDQLTVMTIDTIQAYASVGGFHGYESSEDWGLQNTLQMSIDMFREFYKPYYKRIVDACHACGMHYIWHNCGYIVDMIPDMIEIGVDVIQLDQPRLTGHENLIRLLGGKMCMWNTVDIQWCTAGNVSDEEIRQEVKEMLRIYDVENHHGGFIAKHYPQPWDINLSPERQYLIYQAFKESGYCTLP